MKLFAKLLSVQQFIFLLVLFQIPLIHTSAIQPDSDGLSTVQADLERLKLGITELQERTMHLAPAKRIEAFYARYSNMLLKVGGKCTQEMFNAANLTYLNSNLTNDTYSYMRATGDFFMDAIYGLYDKSRIVFHNTLRVRYRWGSGADARSDGEILPLLDGLVQARGASINKHVFWNRELWLKFILGNLQNPHEHYLELGSFPYEVGRGISFGAAYKAAGFIGFTPSFSIDQFAPGILLRLNPLPEKLIVDLYAAILENQNTSYKSNNAKIRLHEIDSCAVRGTGRESYAAIVRASWKAIAQKDRALSFEPYALYFQSLDQKLEMLNDVDSYVSTFGCAVEGKYKKFDWGFECAVNQGDILIKAIDRNSIKFVRDADGFIVEQYTKVLNQNPATTDKPTSAVVSDTAMTVVKAGQKSVAENGKEIVPGSNLYNAYDRFRPQQKALLDGYMVVADCAWQCIDDVLNIVLGTGYASGDLSAQQNMNNPAIPLIYKYNGFITLQSVYSGTRLRHLVIFNEGTPRFNTLNPNATFAKQNVTPPFADSAIEFTNIAFFGTRVELQVPAWKKYKVVVAPNIIGYWCPVQPNTKAGTPAGNYMGTELTTEISAQFYKQFKLYSYFGLIFPGAYYKDMRGTPYQGEVTGSSIGYLGNIGASFSF